MARISPSFRPVTLFLIALSLSIGWGIRGNFGHEFGAMMAGALAGIAVSLFSGREDWRRRVPYFAFFGALGWGFGGSIAYMPVMAYTQGGHLPTQIYGFFVTFMTGALWTGMGGVGTAYAAVEERDKLTEIFKPLCWIFALWTVQYFGEDVFVHWYQTHVHGLGPDSADFRQRSPLYWLDSEWVEATLAITALCAYDLWDRRFEKFWTLVRLGGLGAAAGFVLQHTHDFFGWLGGHMIHAGSILATAGTFFVKLHNGVAWIGTWLLSLIVHTQGDLTAINPATNLPYDPKDMVTNWPTLFSDLYWQMGWILGLLLGIGVYFHIHGKWRSGSRLLMHIAAGSYLCFLIFPVLLSNLPPFQAIGGFRMMPPRGDSWANTVGAFAGALVYTWRYDLRPVTAAGVTAFFLGGLSFITAQFIKILALIPGNPVLEKGPAVIEKWAHWRSANWHSIVAEQGVGFFYGLSIAVTMGLLASRAKSHAGEPRVRKWTEGFAVAFILNVLVYVNMVKCVEDWTCERAGGFRSMPLSMKMPLVSGVELSSFVWFTLLFLLITACTVAVMVSHTRRPIAAVPRTWLGIGQLFFLLFLWAIVIGNFLRAVVAFGDGRLATEGMIAVNGLIVTYIILAKARDNDPVSIREPEGYGPFIVKWTITGLVAAVLCSTVYLNVNRSFYGNKPDGWGGAHPNMRFGPNADWRVRPVVKSVIHR